MSTHLVTGGSGFIGSEIVKELINQNENIKILDLIEPDEKILKSPNVEFFKGSILDDELLKNIFKDVNYVHHTAALVPLKKAGKDFWNVNVLGTEKLIKKSIENNVSHFSHISSSAVFGNVEKRDCPISKDPENLKPIEIYGRSKMEAENRIKLMIKNEKNSTTFSILRPRTVIGTERLGIFEVLYEWINDNKNIFIIGNGDNIFQFVHVKDIVNVSILSCYKKKNNIYNVGTDKYGTLKECLNNLIKYANSQSKVKPLPIKTSIFLLKILDILQLSPLGPWHYLTYHKDFFYDLDHTKKELDWKPIFSNDQMLKESYNWYLTNKNELSNTKSSHKSKIKQGILKVIKLFA